MVSDDCCAEFPGLSGGVEPNGDVSVTCGVGNPMAVLSAGTPEGASTSRPRARTGRRAWFRGPRSTAFPSRNIGVEVGREKLTGRGQLPRRPGGDLPGGPRLRFVILILGSLSSRRVLSGSAGGWAGGEGGKKSEKISGDKTPAMSSLFRAIQASPPQPGLPNSSRAAA